MEITAFNPIIFTSDAQSAIALFEELGFECRHRNERADSTGTVTVRMKNADGFRIDIAQPAYELRRDVTQIRINVRDFDETCKLLEESGFIDTKGTNTFDDGSALSKTLVAPSGLTVTVAHHIRKQ